MRKAPTRPNNDITQQYNSGVLTVCALTDAAQPGYKPILKLTPKAALRYEERRLGIARLYQSRQAQVEITEDGRQYRIDTVQAVMDVWPPSLDMSLVRITQAYEVMR